MVAKGEIVLTGIPASPGISIGPCYLYVEKPLIPDPVPVREKSLEAEISRFRRAVKKTHSYLKKSYQDTARYQNKNLNEILELQLAILEDDIFLKEVEDLIRAELYNAAYATYKVFRNKTEYFLRMSDEYFRDRAFDIQAIKRLIIKHIYGKKTEINLRKPAIVVADILSPAETVRLHQQSVLGFATNSGGKNSHTAIVARSLEVPAVVGAPGVTKIAKTAKSAILDGIHGRVIFNPRPETISAYEAHRKSYIAQEKSLLKETTPITKTKDGKRIYIQANIEFEEELNNIHKVGADGIGLFRTEGIFINRQVLPTEEEQFEIYDRIARQVYPKKVVIRTLDVGGDKIMPDLINIQERNPNLGWRAIRFCLDHSECFLAQLKAILRANARGNVQLLLPMISSLEEVHQVKELLRESKKLLGREGKEYGENLELGIMVEVPSVVFIADIFAEEVDFFSIGTNDLVQYNLAVDRGNEKVAYLYSHFHPSVLRMIKHTLDAGKKAGIPVSLCGEMAADPLAIPLLLAMGFEYLSASHFIIPEIKKIIRELTMEECKNLYKNVMKLRTTKEITGTLHDFFKERFYELEII